MTSLILTASFIKENYWPLFKSRQTLLLTFTGLAGFLYQTPYPPDWMRLSGLIGSLLLTISGCSVLNMLFDRDIDRRMRRTRHRPLANGQVRPAAAAILGGSLILLGLLWALYLSWFYAAVVSAGIAFNILVYTLWLKRRTAWSILWGGIAGSMPILAGRVLSIGGFDIPGLVLGLIIMGWIPSHNLTLSSLYAEDYQEAGVPTFLNSYGTAATRGLIALSSLLTVLFSFIAFAWLHPAPVLVWVLAVASIGLLVFSFSAWIKPSRPLTMGLYKYSSFYMLLAMLLLAVGG